MNKKEKTKQGISLIVLVITILVMTILTTTIIISLSNDDVINKASDAVQETNIKQIKELIKFSWTEAYMNGARKEQEFVDAVNATLAANKITEEDYAGYTLEITVKGANLVKKETSTESPDEPSNNQPSEPSDQPSDVPSDESPYDALNHGGTIPEGGTYYVGAYFDDGDATYSLAGATVYSAGTAFPSQVSLGDIYRYGDYEYCYGREWGLEEAWEFVASHAGWGVAHISDTSTPGAILKSINEQPITSLDYVFCGRLISSIENITIPDTVINMRYAFENQTNLNDITGLVIPESVKNLEGVFEGATNITGTITINADPTEYDGSFSNTTKSIVLTGSSTLLESIAATSENGNVTVAE